MFVFDIFISNIFDLPHAYAWRFLCWVHICIFLEYQNFRRLSPFQQQIVIGSSGAPYSYYCVSCGGLRIAFNICVTSVTTAYLEDKIVKH